MKNEHKIVLIAVLFGVALSLTVIMAVVIRGDIRLLNLKRQTDNIEMSTVVELTEDKGKPVIEQVTVSNKDSIGLFSDSCTLQHQIVLDDQVPHAIRVEYGNTPYDVIFQPASDNKITIEEYFNQEALEEDFVQVSWEEDKTLVLTQKHNRSSSTGSFTIMGTPIGNVRTGFWGYVKIYLPLETYNQLKELVVLTSSGDISLPVWKEAESIMEKVQMTTQSGDIEGRFAASSVMLTSSSGYQYLQGVYGDDITITSTSGDIEAESVAGQTIQITASSGNIQLKDIKGESIGLKTQSGDVDIEESAGTIEIQTNSGYQQIKNMTGNLRMSSSSGDLQIYHMTGEFFTKSASGNQEFEGISGSGECSAQSGDIEIQLNSLEQNLNIETSSGSIDLKLPTASAFEFHADTNSGNIETWFDDELRFNKKGNSAEGSIGSGNTKHQVTLTTTSGDIYVDEN